MLGSLSKWMVGLFIQSADIPGCCYVPGTALGPGAMSVTKALPTGALTPVRGEKHET